MLLFFKNIEQSMIIKSAKQTNCDGKEEENESEEERRFIVYHLSGGKKTKRTANSQHDNYTYNFKL